MRQIYLSSIYAHLVDVFKQFICKISQNKKSCKAYILVPSTWHAQYLQLQIGTSIGIRYSTILEMADNIRATREHSSKVPQSPYLTSILCQKILSSTMSQHSGLGHSMQDTIDELKNVGIFPSKLTEIAKSSSKLSAIATTYESLVRSNIPEMYLASSCLLRATNFLEDGHPLQEMPLFVYGFYRFSWPEKKFLEKLFHKQEIHVCMPTYPGNVGQVIKPALHWLLSLDFEQCSLDDATSSNWTHSLFQDKESPSNTYITPTLQIISCSSSYQETQIAFQKSLAFLPNVGIVSRTDSFYYAYLSKILENKHIPFSTFATPHNFSKELTLLLEILELIEKNGHAHFWNTIVQSPLVQWENILGSKYARKSIEEWPRFSLLFNLPASWEQWYHILEYHKHRIQEDETSGLKTSVEFKEAVYNIEKMVEYFHTWQKACLLVKSYKQLYQSLTKLYKHILQNTPEVEMYISQLASIQQLDNFDIPVSIENVLQFLENMQQSLTSNPTTQSSAICMTEMSNFVGIPLDVVIFPGMIEKEFPPAFRNTTLLSEKERIMINKANKTGIELLTNREYILEQKFLFSLTLVNTNKNIILTWHRHDSLGNPCVPSLFLLEACKAYGGEKVFPHDFSSRLFFIENISSQLAQQDPEKSCTPLDYHIMTIARYPSLLTTSSFLKKQYPNFCSALQRHKAREATCFTIYDGLIQKKSLLSYIKSLTILKNTQAQILETYAVCPNRFFWQYILQIQPRHTNNSSIHSLEHQGQTKILSQIIERFHTISQKEKDTQNPSSKKECLSLQQIAHVVESVLETLTPSNTSFLSRIIWDITKEKIASDMKFFWSVHDVKKSTVCLHKSYPQHPSMPVISVLPDARRITWEGRWDEVIQTSNGYESRQYRFSKKTKNEKDDTYYGGQRLVLPVDLLALQTLFPSNTAKEYRSCYYYIGYRGSNGVTEFTNDKYHFQKYLAQIAFLIINGIENGYFFQISDQTQCPKCPYNDICNVQLHEFLNMKQSDPSLIQLAQLRATK